ncbi:MAG: hypothetical protein ABR955_09870 [Verrucomicrobiota bacterium]
MSYQFERRDSAPRCPDAATRRLFHLDNLIPARKLVMQHRYTHPATVLQCRCRLAATGVYELVS